MTREHTYATAVTWTGNRGTGTSGYRAYDRNSDIAALAAGSVATIAGSSDPTFRGDPSRWNPEQLLVASVSQCHMLWYLHLCAVGGVVVTDYVDRAVGVMTEDTVGSGRFTHVVLRPQVTVSDASMVDDAVALHDDAHQHCFVANSVNFPIRHEPQVTVKPPSS